MGNLLVYRLSTHRKVGSNTWVKSAVKRAWPWKQRTLVCRGGVGNFLDVRLWICFFFKPELLPLCKDITIRTRKLRGSIAIKHMKYLVQRPELQLGGLRQCLCHWLPRCLSSCHPHGKSRWSPRFVACIWPSPGFCGRLGSEPMVEALLLCFYFFSLSQSVPQRNKQHLKYKIKY